MTRALGPVTLSRWGQPGLLVRGFDTPASVVMGHARPYMGGHIERAGYAKAQDLIAYDYDVTRPMPSTGLRAVQRANARPDVAFRPMRMDRRHIKAEIETIVDIMHDAWSDNFGFVPMTQAEVAKIAGELRLVLRPVDTCIAEVGGRPMAFAMIFPNLNDAIRDLDGRLFPFGWAKLLWRLKVRRPTTGRMPLMGLRKELQATALGGALALGVIEKTRALHAAEGARRGELSWILEQNLPVRHIIEMIGGIAYKRYRIYGKSLPG